ncbi:MAG: hypothetical protein ABIP02_02340, partial [Arenimonas sp.]
RQCRATPQDKRQPGLAQACENAQNDRDKKAGHELLLHQARQVSIDCEATPDQGSKGPLFYACISYQSALESALQTLLVDDDAGYAIMCNDGRQPTDRAFFANMACSGAEDDRRDRTIKKLLADPAALDTACASKSLDDKEIALHLACSQRHRDLWLAKAEQLAADPAAYKLACGAIEAQHKDPMSTDLDEKEFLCADAKRARELAKEKTLATNLPETVEAPAVAVSANEPSEFSIYEADSDLSKVALESAQRVIAKSKAEGTYPKRRRGDVF